MAQGGSDWYNRLVLTLLNFKNLLSKLKMKPQPYIKSWSHSAVVGECWWEPAHSTEGQEKARADSSGNVEDFQTASSWLRWSWHTEWNRHTRNSPFLVDQNPVFERYLLAPSVWHSRRCSRQRWSCRWCCTASRWKSRFAGSTGIPSSSGLSAAPGDPLSHSCRCQSWWSAVSSHSAQPRAP